MRVARTLHNFSEMNTTIAEKKRCSAIFAKK
jgi:hypothetical protein